MFTISAKFREDLNYSITLSLPIRATQCLNIERVQTSCGCTGATVGDQKDYKKNESGEIKVNFSTQGREGHQEKTIIVFSNDPENPQKVITVKCDIDPEMTY